MNTAVFTSVQGRTQENGIVFMLKLDFIIFLLHLWSCHGVITFKIMIMKMIVM